MTDQGSAPAQTHSSPWPEQDSFCSPRPSTSTTGTKAQTLREAALSPLLAPTTPFCRKEREIKKELVVPKAEDDPRGCFYHHCRSEEEAALVSLWEWYSHPENRHPRLLRGETIHFWSQSGSKFSCSEVPRQKWCWAGVRTEIWHEIVHKMSPCKYLRGRL